MNSYKLVYTLKSNYNIYYCLYYGLILNKKRATHLVNYVQMVQIVN